MRRFVAVLVALAIALAGVSAAVPATAGADGGTPRITCERGERAEYPKGQLGYPRTLVLGCIRLPEGDRLQLEGRRVRNSDGTSSSCFSLTLERPTGSFACPRHPPAGDAPRLYLFLHPRVGEPVLALGKVGRGDRGVVATATTPSGGPRQAEAELVQVPNRLGRRIGAPGEFALYVAPLEPRINPCAGITLQSTHSDLPVTELSGPKRRSFMRLADGGWIAGMAYSWGIGTGGTPRICDRPFSEPEPQVRDIATGIIAIRDAATSAAAGSP